MISLLIASLPLFGVSFLGAPAQGVASRYTKFEYRIPMRDGVKLYTAVYVPKNKPGKMPILLERTPYSAGPYGKENFPGSVISKLFEDAGYIVAFQDVRGRFMSEGKFIEIRPQTTNPNGIDESTDAYDTIDYLVKNVPTNNGNVGLTGVSYPGFYAATAGINSHPALKAISPQAPVAEWFLGDDVHHNGAFFLQDNFDFYFWFGYDKPGPAEDHPQIEPMPMRQDAYKFFLELGSAINADRKYYKGRFPFWLDICNHESMDEFWQARSTPSKMKNVKCAVLTVGGLFDAEDAYGPFAMYRNIEKLNPGIEQYFVFGPWMHGQWSGGPANRVGKLNFGNGNQLGTYFRNEIEFPFFEKYLRGVGEFKRPKVSAFDTGAKQWSHMDVWPPKGISPASLYLLPGQKASFTKPTQPAKLSADSYISDPAKPVPYAPGVITDRPSSYMVEDQRYLAGRNDVLSYMTSPLENDITVAGPIDVNLFASSSGTDADFVVKVIDVYPDSAEGELKSAQIQIRADVMRAKFRNSFSKPEPMKPNQVHNVQFRLVDMFHTFKKGHRMMVQVQSSWFPLVDRNTHKFQNLYYAKPADYQKATIKIYHQAGALSSIRFGILKQ